MNTGFVGTSAQLLTHYRTDLSGIQRATNPHEIVFCAWPNFATSPSALVWAGSMPFVSHLSGSFVQSPGSVTYTATWKTFDVYVDGILYQEGIKDARVRVSGITHDMSVTDTVLASQTMDMGEMDGVPTGTQYYPENEMDFVVRSTEWRLIQCTGTVTVTQTGGPVEFQNVNSTYGVDYAWATSHFVPVADVQFSYTEPTATLDASASYTNDSPITNYNFTLRNAATLAVIYNSSGASDSVTFNLENLLSQDTDVVATVTITNAFGCTDDDDIGPAIKVLLPHTVGMSALPLPITHTVSRNDTNLALAEYKNGIASRDVIHTFTNAKQGSIWVKSTSAMRVLYDTGVYYTLAGSNDLGRTFTTMATIWSSATHYRAAACGMIGGGAASVAAQRNTSPLAIKSKVTTNENNWNNSGVVNVGTYSGTATQFTIRQLSEDGKGDLVITNGVDAMWKSSDAGITWDAF